MGDATTPIGVLRQAVQRFAAERAWEPFHSPKNLAMGLAVEVAELMEHFLWVDCEASRVLSQNESKCGAIADEVADVACYLFNLCHVLQLDLSQAVRAKLLKNAQKYPVEKYKGKFEV